MIAALTLAAVAACGGGDRRDTAAADSLSRDLQLAPVDTTAELNDQPAASPPAPAARTPAKPIPPAPPPKAAPPGATPAPVSPERQPPGPGPGAGRQYRTQGWNSPVGKHDL